MSNQKEYLDIDLTAEDRKSDHIELAFKSQQKLDKIDSRFYYEPLLSTHLTDKKLLETTIFGKKLNLPFWVSSMTGGTQKAKTINTILAKACGTHGMGMGLGSCRGILFTDDHLVDFQVKKYMPDMPLYANLGIAQLEQIADAGNWNIVQTMMNKLDADGLIIHINPLQEWVQPEGDRFNKPPLETIKKVIDHIGGSIIVKEVGQGMGPKSLKSLLQLPLDGIEFGASGGTNFAMIELLRSNNLKQKNLQNVTHLGHTAEEMVDFINDIKQIDPDSVLVKDIIISGGVRDFLDSFYLRKKCNFNAVSGHASGFLRYALLGEEALDEYINIQSDGLLMAESFLTLK